MTLRDCPGHAYHFTMFELPAKRPSGHSHCYVNPFVFHGYYATYLAVWLEVFPPANFLVVDYEDLSNDAATVLDGAARFLGLRPFGFDVSLVYNTRHNRGVHEPGTSKTIGGEMRPAKRRRIEPWRASPATLDVLEVYYRTPNRDLVALLTANRLKVPSFAYPDSPKPIPTDPTKKRPTATTGAPPLAAARRNKKTPKPNSHGSAL